MDERAAAFIRQPGLARMWLLVKRKYESYGVAGTIRLSHLSDEERSAFADLFAINMLGRSEFRFTLQDLNRVLVETRFKWTVEDSLAILYGEEVIMRHVQTEAELREWEGFCHWAGGFAFRTEQLKWMEQLKNGKTAGYRAFLECYEQYRLSGECTDWVAALGALQQLPADMECSERLPLFAARTTGDAHGLDRDHLAGRIFYWGMVAAQQADRSEGGGQSDVEIDRCSEIEDATGSDRGDDRENQSEQTIGNVAGSEESRAQYAQAGLMLDDISSTVMTVGWGTLARIPVSLPLFAIERLELGLPRIEDLYVVENPSIFGALLDYWGDLGRPVPFPLLCTSGQPSLAALRLMDLTAVYRTNIHYSGDFDVKGLEMAEQLRKRYDNRFFPWFMDAETYVSVQQTQANLPSFSAKENTLLARMQVSWDTKLPDIILEQGNKVFQEHIIHLLLEDWKRKEVM